MKYRKIISLVVSSVLLLNLFSVLSLVAQAEEIVGTSVVSCPKQSISDAISGRTYYYMNIDGKTTIKPYVTAQNWNSDGTKFLVMTPDDRKMYEYDTVRETLRFLDYGEGSTSLNAVVTPDNQIYYVYNKNIYKIDWNTYTKTLVCPFPYGCKSIGSLQITNDGRYANGYFSGYSGANSVVRIDLESGEIDFVKKKGFQLQSRFCRSGTSHYQSRISGIVVLLSRGHNSAYPRQIVDCQYRNRRDVQCF